MTDAQHRRGDVDGRARQAIAAQGRDEAGRQAACKDEGDRRAGEEQDDLMHQGAGGAPAGASAEPDLFSTHRLIATVSTDDLAAAAAAVADLPAGTVAEVRLDRLWPGPPDPDQAADQLEALLAAAGSAGVRLLATLRPKRHGGGFEGPEPVRLGLLVAAARAGAAVDVEADLADVRPVMKAIGGAPVVLSDHLPAAPGRDTALRHLLGMQDVRAALHKLAFPVGDFAAALRALELAHAHRGRHGRPCIVPMGKDPGLRALLGLVGNAATYGHAGLGAEGGQPAAAAVQAVWRHWGLEGPPDGHGPWAAVLGLPTAHSLSPRLHNAACAKLGLPGRYGALDVPDSPAAFRLVATVAPRLGLGWASVTAPHKQRAADVAATDAVATAVGAANCLRFTPQGTHATNTDAIAFKEILQAHRDHLDSVAVVGAGGAARAALWACRETGLPAVFTSRDPKRAERVREDLGATWVPWQERDTVQADAWVQATPADVAVPAARLLVDLAYPGPTTAASAAREQGTTVVDGTAFLLAQAVHAFRFGTGHPADRAAMAAALEGRG